MPFPGHPFGKPPSPNPGYPRAVQKTRWRLIEPQGMGRPQSTVEQEIEITYTHKLNIIYIYLQYITIP